MKTKRIDWLLPEDDIDWRLLDNKEVNIKIFEDDNFLFVGAEYKEWNGPYGYFDEPTITKLIIQKFIKKSETP